MKLAQPALDLVMDMLENNTAQTLTTRVHLLQFTNYEKISPDFYTVLPLITVPPNTAPPNTAPPNTAAHFKFKIWFLRVILPPNNAVLEYRRFFASPENGGIGRDDCIFNPCSRDDCI